MARTLVVALAVGAGLSALAAPPAAPVVEIVRTVPWTPSDPARDGAAELLVLLKLAQLRPAGLRGVVAVGDRRGLFSAGAEAALQRAARQGVPVVKLSASGRALAAPDGLFLDGGSLPEDEACRVLARCLARYGAPPAVGTSATPAELAPLRARLQLYQDEFALAAAPRLAAR